MKIKYNLLLILGLLLVFSACNKDDDDPTPPVEETISREDQQVIDKDSLIGYLETHYYNADELAGIQYPTIDDLVITELPEGGTLPAGHNFLIDDVEVVSDFEFKETEYEYYYLKLNQGGGVESPNFTDIVRMNYQGFTLDKNPNDISDAFDSAINPVDFDLVSLIQGWSLVIPEFNEAEGFVENGDGTVTYSNSGAGIMFLPSGLAYFSGTTPGIDAYSPLIFKFELYQVQLNVDHDSDGIPSYAEDVDGNHDVKDDDTNENDVSDYNDPDDDGDGVLTINELEQTEYEINVGDPDPIFGANEFEFIREEADGKITITTLKMVDANNNSVFDHLDEEATTNYNDD